MVKTLRLAHLLITLLAAGLLSPLVGFSEQEPGPLKVAVVDIVRVGDEYQALSVKNQELEEWRNVRQTYLVRLETFGFLSQENFKEASQLLELPQPLSPDDATRLQELASISASKEEQYQELQSNTARTPAETDEFNALYDGLEACQQELAAIAEELNVEFEDKRDDAKAQLLQEVDRVIAAYAQQHDYDIVLDGAWVLYGGEDITDRIIEQLNQPAAAGAEEEAATSGAETEGAEGEEGGGS